MGKQADHNDSAYARNVRKLKLKQDERVEEMLNRATLRAQSNLKNINLSHANKYGINLNVI